MLLILEELSRLVENCEKLCRIGSQSERRSYQQGRRFIARDSAGSVHLLSPGTTLQGVLRLLLQKQVIYLSTYLAERKKYAASKVAMSGSPR